MKKILNFFTLFTSLSTLICCALPALLVGLGMGAALAGFLSQYPQLIWISENKLGLFLIGGILLILGGALQFRGNQIACPVDSKGQACSETKKSSKVVYIASVIIYLIGFNFAYIIPQFLD